MNTWINNYLNKIGWSCKKSFFVVEILKLILLFKMHKFLGLIDTIENSQWRDSSFNETIIFDQVHL